MSLAGMLAAIETHQDLAEPWGHNPGTQAFNQKPENQLTRVMVVPGGRLEPPQAFRPCEF